MNPLSQTRGTRELTHLLQTPDTFVRTPLPGIAGGTAVVHACPALGAGFVMFTCELEAGGTLLPGPHSRFFYVLSGGATIMGRGRSQPVVAGDYAYAPATDPLTLLATMPTRCVVIDKAYEALAGVPQTAAFTGRECDVKPEPLGGDAGLLVRAMVPAGLEYDFAVNTMEYAGNAALAQVEMHYMEHGLLMLAGAGPYRLGDKFYDVEAGDFIWMAPYCPQWFQASAAGPAKYLIYKNFNRMPAL